MLTLLLIPCLLAATAYIVFGILHMLAPRQALRVYRLALGKAAWQRAEPAFLALAQRSWKLLGAFHITCGLLLAWALMHVTTRFLNLT